MASNTRKNTAATLGTVTRSSVAAKRSISLRSERTTPPSKTSRPSFVSDSKKDVASPERKSYSLRNGKQPNNEMQSSKRNRSPKEKDSFAKKVIQKDDVVCVSDNSNDSGEIEFNPEIYDSKKCKTNSSKDVVILSSDDEVLLLSPNKKSPAKNPSVSTEPVKTTNVSGLTETDTKNKPVTEKRVKELSSSAKNSGADKGDAVLSELPSEGSPNTSFLSTTSSNEEPKSDPIELSCPESNNDCNSSVPKITFEIVPSDKDVGQKTETAVRSKANQGPLSAEVNEKQIQALKCKVYDPNAEDVSLNVPDRPVSSNSRSTTSVSSSAPLDNDLYSPGSTDLSMSEDSRGSFKESGSEKAPSSRRQRGRIKSRLTFRNVRRYKRQATNVSSSRSPSEDRSVEPPNKRTKRLPHRVGIVWEIGQRLEAVDHNEWYPAKIVEVDRDACEVLIHFEGWSVRFDEWVPMDSPKLRPPSTSKADPREKLATKQQFKPNEKILARWNDGKFYQATVTQVINEGHYLVLFFDGFTKKLPVASLRKLNDKTIKDKKVALCLPPREEVSKVPFQRSLKGTVTASATPRLSSVSAATNTPSSLASKQFVVETDHNQFKCTYGDCNKEFRKEVLLESHVKHYHLLGRTGPSSPRKFKTRNKSQSIRPEEKPKSLEKVVEDVRSPAKPETVEETTEPEPEPEVQTPETAEAPAISLEENLEENTEPAESAVTPTSSVPEETVEPEKSKTEEPKPDDKPVSKDESRVEPPVVKVSKPLPRKEVYPVTKMETRHAKPCLFRNDSIYTGYMSYRSLYTKNSRGPRKSTDTDSSVKKGKSSKNEDEKTVGEGRKRKRRVFKKPNIKKQKFDSTEIDDEIAEIKKRRVDRVSESSVRTDDTTTRESGDYDDDETVSDQQEIYDDELVRCICENEEENGLMFQCEECKTWQHAACFNIENEEDVPDTYFCYICIKAKGTPVNILSTENEAWLSDGVLSTFNFLTDNSATTSRPNAMLATHELVNSANKVLFILKSLQYKIQIAGLESHPDLKHWSKPWKKTAKSYVARKPEMDEQSARTSGLPSQSTSDSHDVLVFDHAYFSNSEGAIGFQEEVVTEISDLPPENIDINLSTNSNVIIPQESANKPDQPSSETKEKTVSKRRVGAREGGRGRGGRWKDAPAPPAPEEEIVDVGVCKNHLIQHIHDVQDSVEHGLDLIENQLNLLEAEMNMESSDNDDVVTVLKSLKNLSKDLDVVQRFTLL